MKSDAQDARVKSPANELPDLDRHASRDCIPEQSPRLGQVETRAYTARQIAKQVSRRRSG